MWLTELALRRPLAIVMAVAALMVFGAIAYTELPVDLLPSTSFPYVFVSIAYPGAGPREVEAQVTKPVEDALAGVNGIKHLSSTSTDNESIVVMEFNDGVNPDSAERDVQLRLNPILGTLPAGTKPPSIAKFDPAAQPSWDLAVTGSRPLDQLYQTTKDDIVPKLEAVDGVASVTITGGLEREVRVEVDPHWLAARGLSIVDVEQALAAANVSIPAGTVHDGRQDYELRLYGLSQGVAALANLPLRTLPDGGTLRLSDVATVAAAAKDPTYYTRVDGKEGIGLLIQKQQGANTVAVADALHRAMASLSLPPGMRLLTVYDQADFVRQSLDSVNTNLREAVVITGIVLLLFLHTWRATSIVLLAIPTSLVSTFAVMRLLGYSLDIMSTMGLALTIGILVDDSIVILENIHRHMRQGEAPRTAALNGRGEIGAAAVAITLVDVVVYTPMALLTGTVGQFFKEFGGTIVVATLFSLAASFTLTPMLAAYWVRPELEERSRFRGLWARWERGYDRLTRAYGRALGGALRRRWLVAAGAALIFVAGLGLAGSGLIGSEFLTEADEGSFSVNVDLPPGTALDETNRQVGILEHRIQQLPEVETLLSSVGIGGQFDRPQHWSAKIAVRLVPKEQRQRSVWQVAAAVHGLARDMPDMQLRTNLPSIVGTTSQPIIVDVQGNDLALVTQQAARVTQAVRGVAGTSDVSTSGDPGSPELRLVVDQTRAAQLGVVPSQLGALLHAAYNGDTATQFRPEGQDPIDVEVRLPAAYRARSADLATLLVPGAQGQEVPLGQVTTSELVPGPSEINRLDRQYDVQIGANLSGRPLGAVSADIQRAVAMLGLPPGVSMSYQGDTQQQQEGFADLGKALLLAVVLMYMLMVALYNSLTYPLVIMFSLPVASVGAFLALLVSHDTFNIMSMVGIIMLTGLVAKNAILLVDYTNTLRGRGLPRRAALLEAGKTRLRPIVMTTAAMVLAMLPLALNLGEGAEVRSSMAVVVVGGLLTSTLLTLFLVPAAYTLMDDLQERVKGRVRRPPLVELDGRVTAALPNGAAASDGAGTAAKGSGGVAERGDGRRA